LPDIYSVADILAFPSKFDTFSCKVLESLSCGLPVIAFITKVPKDIIEEGFVDIWAKLNCRCAKNNRLNNSKLQKHLRKTAAKRVKKYDVESIVEQFLADVGLKD